MGSQNCQCDIYSASLLYNQMLKVTSNVARITHFPNFIIIITTFRVHILAENIQFHYARVLHIHKKWCNLVINERVIKLSGWK